MSDELGVPRGSAPEPTQLPGSEILDHGAGATTITPSQTHRASSPKRRWVLPAVGASVLMLAVASAGVALGVMFSGGGTQPEELVPSNALFYADVDFDPTAEQKANLVRLLNKFPDLHDQLDGVNDVQKSLVEGFVNAYGVDYYGRGKSDPLENGASVSWLGDRVGFAVVPADDNHAIGLVAVIQVSDEDAARASLDGVVDPEQVAFDSGYVLITSKKMNFSSEVQSLGDWKPLVASDVLEAAHQSPLSDDATFTSVLDPLGDGIASVYVDTSAISDISSNIQPLLLQWFGLGGLQSGLGQASDQDAGQLGAVLRIDPTDVEIVARSTQALSDTAGAPAELFAGLPKDTAAAVDFVGGGDQVSKVWQQYLDQLDQMAQDFSGYGGANGYDPRHEFDRQVAKFEARYNMKIPEDIATLLGDEVSVAVSGDGLVGPIPSLGARSLTDPAEATDLSQRLQPVIDDLTAGLGVSLQPTDDGLVVASTPAYAQTLVAGEGGIMDNPAVVRALPDADGASVIAWVDLDVIGDLAGLAGADQANAIEPLEGIGITVQQDTDGQTIQARLTFDE